MILVVTFLPSAEAAGWRLPVQKTMRSCRGMALPAFNSPAPSCCYSRQHREQLQTVERCLYQFSSRQAALPRQGMVGRYTGAGIKKSLGANSSNSVKISCPVVLLPSSLLKVHVLLDLTSKTSPQDSKTSLINEKIMTQNYSKT